MDIRSDRLKDLFRHWFKDVEGLELHKEPPVVSCLALVFLLSQILSLHQASPQLIYHARNKLEARKAEEKKAAEPDQILIDDIGTALRFVHEDFGERMASFENLTSHGEITFDLLWMLFPPNELLYAPRCGLLHQELACRLRAAIYGERANKREYYLVRGYVVNHDGDIFGYGQMKIEIDEYVGARRLTDLNIYPLRFEPNRDLVRQGLITRGRKYLSYVDSPTCLEYEYDYAIMEVISTTRETEVEGPLLTFASTSASKVSDSVQRFRVNVLSSLSTLWAA